MTSFLDDLEKNLSDFKFLRSKLVIISKDEKMSNFWVHQTVNTCENYVLLDFYINTVFIFEIPQDQNVDGNYFFFVKRTKFPQMKKDYFS
jgi:hypothetical protein